MSTIERDAQHLVTLIRKQLVRPEIIVRLWRLLVEYGEPVTIEQLAMAGGWSVDEVQAVLAAQPGTDFDEDGRVAGFGLTLVPTTHTFTFDGRTVYGFCASDVLDFAIVLGRPGTVRSPCPVTGRTVRVEVTPETIEGVDPIGAVVSRIRPAEAVADLRTQICALGSFFSSAEAASGWLASNPDGQVVPVEEDFEVNRRALSQLGWTSA